MPVNGDICTGHDGAQPPALLLEAFESVDDPQDVRAILKAYLALVDSVAPLHGVEPLPHPARRHRSVRPRDLLREPALPEFVKSLFNHYFKQDVYGPRRNDGTMILSSGSVDETTFPTPRLIKHCIRYALSRDWYGYSDSRGRTASRRAIASLESIRIPLASYDVENVSLTLGNTSAVSAIADQLALNGVRATEAAPAICATPNYPPLIAAIARRFPIRFVPLDATRSPIDLSPLIKAVQPDTPLVFLQTVINPTGLRIDERQIARLVSAASNARILLDESHECFGDEIARSLHRTDEKVIRIVSMSKTFSIPGLKMGYVLGSRDFIRDFYEYASTTYGSPPSLFYLAMELLVTMERWRVSGCSRITPAMVGEIESELPWAADVVASHYQHYCKDHAARSRRIVEARHAAVTRCDEMGMRTVCPTHSLNVLFEPFPLLDSYVAFRRIYQRSNITFFPAILSFMFDDGWCRLSPAVAPERLITALDLLADLRQNDRAVFHRGLTYQSADAAAAP